MNNLFPDIKNALRGKLVKEDDLDKMPDPMAGMDTQQRIKYQAELNSLNDKENQLHLQIDKIKQEKEDLKKKYNLSSKSTQVEPWSKTGIQNPV